MGQSSPAERTTRIEHVAVNDSIFGITFIKG